MQSDSGRGATGSKGRMRENIKGMTSKPYRYEPLRPRQIRLVQAERHTSTGFHSCKFRAVDLDDLPVDYVAISYCWGNPSRVSKVNCAGGGTLDITSSVEDVLHWLTDSHRVDYFWIDLLSINQDDLMEKTEQVSIMWEIYSRALRVDAWLGSEVENGDEAIEFLSRLYHDIVDLIRDTGKLDDATLACTWEEKSHASHLWKLTHFLQNPWFRRVWVIQEIVLAPYNDGSGLILNCNNSSIIWLDFGLVVQHFFHRLSEIRRMTDVPTTELGITRTSTTYAIRAARWTHGPPDLAWGLLRCEAGDVRDKVYTVMNMCRKLKGEGLVPDYQASVQHVYARVASALLVDNHFFDTLAGTGIGLRRWESDLPSWVPDWSCLASGTTAMAIYEGKSYKASGSHLPYIQGDWNAHCLTFQGILLDQVSHICPLPQGGYQPLDDEVLVNIGPQAISWVDYLLGLVGRSGHYNARTTAEKEIIVSRTISSNQLEHHDVHDPERLLEAFYLWLEENECPDDARRGSLPSDKRYLLDQFERGLGCHALSNVFGTDVLGLLGFGPKGLEGDDRMCILHGLRRPCLLRPNKLIDQKLLNWEFVGICYVDGIMYGEGLDMGEKQEFTIV